MITTAKKTKQVVDFCRGLKNTQRIILSEEGNLNVPSDIDDTYQYYKAKPSGVWYSHGPAWVEFLTENYRRPCGVGWRAARLTGYTHIYKLSVNLSRICLIQDAKAFDAFTKQYGHGRNKLAVNWPAVAKDWSGIEIKFLEERLDVPWYEDWDVSGGCVWSSSAVRRIETLAAWSVAQWKGGVISNRQKRSNSKMGGR